MFRSVSFVLSAAVILTTQTALADESEQQQWVRAAVVDVFQPQVDALSSSSAKLQQALAASCDASQARAAFVAVVADYSQLEYSRIGAMNSSNRAERIFFWPDRKGTGQKQLRRLLADPTRAELDGEAIAKKSVALQGLPALERILYAKEQQINAADCAVAKAIADNVHTIVVELQDDWHSDKGVAQRLQNPAPDALYRSHQESVAALLTLAESGLESISDKKIKLLIKGLLQLAELPKNAPFWRSGRTLDNLKNNLHGIEALLMASGMAKAAAVEGSLSFEFQNAARMIDAVDEALQADDAETAAARLEALGFVLQSLNALVSENVAVKLGIVTGFNSSDGD